MSEQAPNPTNGEQGAETTPLPGVEKAVGTAATTDVRPGEENLIHNPKKAEVMAYAGRRAEEEFAKQRQAAENVVMGNEVDGTDWSKHPANFRKSAAREHVAKAKTSREHADELEATAAEVYDQLHQTN